MTAFILFIALLYGIAGHFVVFKTLQNQYRQQAKEFAEHSESEDDLTHFILTSSMTQSDEFRWIKEHEFRYQGRMYDIVKSEIIDGQRHVHCYHDKKEEKLIARFTRQIFVNKHKDQSSPQNYLINALKRANRQFFEKPFSIKFKMPRVEFLHFKPYINNYQTQKNQPPTPPPNPGFRNHYKYLQPQCILSFALIYLNRLN